LNKCDAGIAGETLRERMAREVTREVTRQVPYRFDVEF
jgi:hypothetical protein